MPRKPHILPGNKNTETPNNCIWVDTETKPKRGIDNRDYHYLWFGWACHQRTRNTNEWTKPDWLYFRKRNQFWDWAISKARPRTRLYIFAHNWGFDGPVLDLFRILPEQGWELTGAVADAPPLILTYKKDRMTIKIVDTLNIWRTSLDEIGKSIGLRKLKMPDYKSSQKRWDAYGRRDVKVIQRACLAWFKFLRDNDLGSFQMTLASQSFTAFRHRFMPAKIFIDNDEETLGIARDSYVGGRTDCFRIGKYTGEFYYIDVNSMYPSVMRKNKYPIKLVGHYRNIDDREVNEWLKDDCMVVQCTVETDEPIYPVVRDGRLIFPVGRFDITLATPEFKYAWEHNHVVSIDTVTLYESAELFTDFIDTLYNLRLEAKHKGDALNTHLYKILMNSLYGKFGQRGRKFKDIGPYDPEVIEVWRDYDADTKTWTDYRAFGGLLQEWVEEGESYNSFPAIASHVTSYARMVLWEAIKSAGVDNCYYCDTDSLVVNAEGYKLLSRLINPDQIGKWTLERTLSRLELYGPKDYVFDDTRRTKGVRASADWLSQSTVEQDAFVGLKGLLRSGSLDAPIVHKIQKTLKREYLKGVVNSDGTVSPFRLWEE